MLRQLGIEQQFTPSTVTVGIGNEIVRLTGKDSLLDYQRFLNRYFPNNVADIERIIVEIKKVMGYMDVLYGIDNPYFMDMVKDRDYFMKTVIPWMFRYHKNIREAQKLNEPIRSYLLRFTKNQSLIDMITQHFFKDTPAFFALSYFSLYLDYVYPENGTGSIPAQMEAFVRAHGGDIFLHSEITTLQPKLHVAGMSDGRSIEYDQVIWCADGRRMYDILDLSELSDPKIKAIVQKQKQLVDTSIGNDSVFTIFLSARISIADWKKACGAHLFYTPVTTGLTTVAFSELRNEDHRLTEDESTLFAWLRRYCQTTTYEISTPALRYPSLAPEESVGIIISTLLEYDLIVHLRKLGWYDKAKLFIEQEILTVLDQSLYHGLLTKIIEKVSSTPLTLEKITGNLGGAMTGWSFTNPVMPAESGFTKIAKSVLSPIPDVLQAGQWTFSPSGLPVSILTGKLAASEAQKRLKRSVKSRDKLHLGS